MTLSLSAAPHLAAVAAPQIQGWKDKLIAQGFQALVFEDALDICVEILESLTAEPPLSLQGLVDKFLDTMTSNYLIMFFRLIISAEVQRRASFFEPFILGMSNVPIGVQKYCQDNIEPMGACGGEGMKSSCQASAPPPAAGVRPCAALGVTSAAAPKRDTETERQTTGNESDNIEALALTDALGVAVKVVYLDRSRQIGASPRGHSGSSSKRSQCHKGGKNHRQGSPFSPGRRKCRPRATRRVLERTAWRPGSTAGGVLECRRPLCVADGPLRPPGSAGRKQQRVSPGASAQPIRSLHHPRAGEDGNIVVNHHDFIPEAVAAAASQQGRPPSVVVHVLYRPGHYDVLYPK